MKRLIIKYLAIAFDSSAKGVTGSGTSLSYSHTCTGADRILFVGVVCVRGGGLGDSVTGVTYNGVAMTQIAKTNDANKDTFIYLYYLINPSTGANNVVVSTSGSADINSASCSYTGAKQSGIPDASNTNKATGVTTLTTSVTTVADNCWTVLYTGSQRTVTSGTGSTTRQTATSGQSLIGDSNSAITPAGSYSMQINLGESSRLGVVMASFAPLVASATNSNFLMLM